MILDNRYEYSLPMKTNLYQLPDDIRFKDTNNNMTFSESMQIESKNNINWVKKKYAKLGIKIIRNGKPEEQTYVVSLPENWRVKHIDNSYWYELLDQTGNVIAKFFHKFYTPSYIVFM